jgi:hypothetical protein
MASKLIVLRRIGRTAEASAGASGAFLATSTTSPTDFLRKFSASAVEAKAFPQDNERIRESRRVFVFTVDYSAF